MKVWISRYALSCGIFQVDAEETRTSTGGVMYKRTPKSMTEFAYGKDWHLSMQSALDRAEEMRENKIASLEKQLAKLKKANVKVIE